MVPEYLTCPITGVYFSLEQRAVQRFLKILLFGQGSLPVHMISTSQSLALAKSCERRQWGYYRVWIKQHSVPAEIMPQCSV